MLFTIGYVIAILYLPPLPSIPFENTGQEFVEVLFRWPILYMWGETKKRVFSYGKCIECHYAIFVKNEKAETARVMALIWLNICSNSFVVSLPENLPDCYKAAFFNNWCLAIIESWSEIRWWEYSQVDSICFCLSCLKEYSEIAFRVILQIKERSIENYYIAPINYNK